jgi:ABC-type multidrug transport system fused ATPase/permease subunit
VRHATQILVLDKGRIIESGTHDELRAQQGAYSRLYDLQFRSATRVDVVPDATPVPSFS